VPGSLTEPGIVPPGWRHRQRGLGKMGARGIGVGVKAVFWGGRDAQFGDAGWPGAHFIAKRGIARRRLAGQGVRDCEKSEMLKVLMILPHLCFGGAGAGVGRGIDLGGEW
jgi:hypothetical protein